jgi:hypothetical protein
MSIQEDQHLLSKDEEDIAIVSISPPKRKNESILQIPEQQSVGEQPESGTSFKI